MRSWKHFSISTIASLVRDWPFNINARLFMLRRVPALSHQRTHNSLQWRGIGEIRLLESSHRQGQDREDMRNAVQQIEEERAALGCLRKLLKTLLRKAREDALAEVVSKVQKRSTKMTFGNNNSRFQAGTINGGVGGLNIRAR